jgi:hypothetical protein
LFVIPAGNLLPPFRSSFPFVCHSRREPAFAFVPFHFHSRRKSASILLTHLEQQIMRLTKPALASLILILTLPALAQTTPPAPTLKVYARETVVDVNVTDAKGNPVHGLTQADFTVKEDGKSQAIRSFEEFGTQPVQPLPKLPPNTYTNLQPPPASSAVNILLLDGLNTAPPDATSLQAPNTTAGATPSGLRPASPVFTSPTA